MQELNVGERKDSGVLRLYKRRRIVWRRIVNRPDALFGVVLWSGLTQNNALRCVASASTLVDTQHDASIESDPILVFSCMEFLRLVEKRLTILVINLCVSRINAHKVLRQLVNQA